MQDVLWEIIRMSDVGMTKLRPSCGAFSTSSLSSLSLLALYFLVLSRESRRLSPSDVRLHHLDLPARFPFLFSHLLYHFDQFATPCDA